jgi:hypothetical protein
MVERAAQTRPIEYALVEVAVVVRARGADGMDLVRHRHDGDPGVVHLADQNAPVVEIVLGEAMSKVHQLAHLQLLIASGTILPSSRPAATP